jgi:DNA polymerase-3 subunit gamma/tau
MLEHHLALYRKYRPQRFDDVVGQEQVVALLTGAIKQHKIGHAYLFCGGRGTGKTSVARIFAREVGCSDQDIIELDAASNRGIDEVRELRDAVRTAPFSSRYKVYILDEAHMLTKEASNALLKTLEEPPSHIIFILATTDPDKLPQTIVSRCQKVIFKQPDRETLAERILYVAHKEGNNKFDIDTARVIASQGKGSYRDALGLLEAMLTTFEEATTVENVRGALGTPRQALLSDLLEALCTKNTQELLENIKQLQSEHGNALRIYDDFIELIRAGLLARIGAKDAEDAVAKLAKEHPHTIASKTILELLKQRHLLTVSDVHGWTAFEAILLSLIEV